MNTFSIKKITKTGLIVAVLAYMPLKAAAWGMIGHRVVGEVASYYLSSKASKGVQKILGTESLAMASNWPDFIKSDSTFNYMGSWHYVNLPGGLDQQGVYQFLNSAQAPNVYTQISKMVALLKDKQSTAEQQKFALRVLIHLVGDVHQPMHTARKEDLGGNKVYVTWFGSRSNLHKVWDESLIEYQQLSYTEYAAVINHPTKAQVKIWKATPLHDYVYESYLICNKIYANVKPDEKLGYRYNFDYASTINEQLLKGGVRLAKIINEIYAVKN
ncbi:S1/P1 nuclease [Pedobacter sp. CG_S7]|uniref:S1/P1 nuclease n=1 Tax=Pedobacter sp. CG_S7 TaxID=3143930 RepID=UPI003399438B